MATTTPNYGWDVPTSTDYVKDGATAIETLGDDIDATLWTALGGAYPGLRLIKKQTIGSAVSSVTVTSAFSATYENYKIIINGGAGSQAANLTLKLGSSTTGYNAGLVYCNFGSSSATAASDSNTSVWNFIGAQDTNSLRFDADLLSPFLAKYTGVTGAYMSDGGGGMVSGVHKVGTSYTDFTITPSAGTFTGGTIYVYGYGIS